MNRYFNLFNSKEEQKAWEKSMKEENENFKVCIRMTAFQLKQMLPFVDIGSYKFATVWTQSKY